jgi:GYF domain 2
MPTYTIIGGDEKQYGPVSDDELRQWIAEGRLSFQSLVLVEGGTEWKPLATFPEFAAALGSQAAARPPVASAPADPAQWANQILAREPELRMTECLRGGFSFLSSNTGFVFGAVFVVWLLNAVMMFTPFIGGIAHWLLGGVLMGGLYLACLRRSRGDPASLTNVFDGFKLCFVQLMLAGALTKLLEQIGLAFCILPGIYLLVAWAFVFPLVADKRLEFWSAMELSRKVVTRVWFPAFLLLLITFLPFLLFQAYSTMKGVALGMDIFRNTNSDPARLMTMIRERMGEIIKMSVQMAVIGQVVLLFNLLFAVGVVVRAYENLFGDQPRAPRFRFTHGRPPGGVRSSGPYSGRFRADDGIRLEGDHVVSESLVNPLRAGCRSRGGNDERLAGNAVGLSGNRIVRFHLALDLGNERGDFAFGAKR